jgi:voltage-gated potassium channel
MGFAGRPSVPMTATSRFTTIGSQYWPESVAGRTLCLLLSVYGLAMFGYVTATLATFFIGRDEAARPQTSNGELPDLRREIRELREGLRAVPRRRHSAPGARSGGAEER